MHTPAPRTLALRTTGITYPGIPQKVSAARADLRSLLAGCPMVDDVVVCVSELASNAVLHSHSRLTGGAFTVRGKISPGNYAWIEVEDDGGSWSPAAYDPERGHGLDIIRALADDWGIDGDHMGRTVWARFDWPSPVTGTRLSDRALRWVTPVEGQQIRHLRRQRGLPREELARLAGISLYTLARLERERGARCRTRTLARLAAALGEHPTKMIAATPLTQRSS